MNFSKLIQSGLVVSVLGFAAVASAADTVHHGSACSAYAADVSKLDFNQFGASNNAATAANIGCGAATPILATINTVQAVAYDRNGGANMSCTLFLLDIFGATLFSQGKSTSGNSPAHQLLTWNPAVGTHTIHIGCNVPGATASGVSHFTTYRVITP